jgi:hypothetical protein
MTFIKPSLAAIRERPQRADAWVADPTALVVGIALAIIAVTGLAGAGFVRDFLDARPWLWFVALLLAFAAPFAGYTHVRIEPGCITVRHCWAGIARRVERHTNTSLVFEEPIQEVDQGQLYYDTGEGFPVRHPDDLRQWLDSQLARLNPPTARS